MKKINIQNKDLILQPSRYQILYLILWILFVFLTIINVGLFLNWIRDNQSYNYENFINSINYYLLLFYLFCIIGLSSIFTIRKHIPLKITFNAKEILFNLKGGDLSIPSNFWQHYFVYKLSGQKNYFFSLFNINHHIKLELFEGNHKQIQTLIEFLKNHLKISLFDGKEIHFKKNLINSKNEEFYLKNRNRNHVYILLMVFILITMFFLKFLSSFKGLNFENLTFIDYLNIFVGMFVFIVFYILIFYNFFNIFFDLKIIKKDGTMFIYKEFFLNPNVKILAKKFILNDDLSCILYLFFDRKYSYIEIFYINQYPTKKLKFMLKNYYKISLFDYNIKEAFEFYKKFINLNYS